MVSTTYLEISSKDQWLRRNRVQTGLVVRECVVRQPQFNRFLYKYVGAQWKWTYRLDWSARQWQDSVGSDDLRTFVAYQCGSIAGYYELKRRRDEVEIGILGLVPGFIGKGYGGFLLDSAIENAFTWGARRVWLHTCANDHPNALNNYLKSGFTVFKVQDE